MPPQASFNCRGQGTYQRGWGDCSANFADHTLHTFILRDDQKSAVTFISSKGLNTLAVGLGIGLSLGLCLMLSLGLLYLQFR